MADPATGRAAALMRDVMLRTARTPLRRVWALAYELAGWTIGLWVTRGIRGATVDALGSFGSRDAVYGLSDLDLLVTVPDAGGADRVRARWEQLRGRIPALQLLVPHFVAYDELLLADALSGPYPVYGLEAGRAVFMGPEPLMDEIMVHRPGLYEPLEGRRRLLGPGPPAVIARSGGRQRVRLDAWLELQHRWHFLMALCLEPEQPHAARLALRIVTEPARIWLWLAHGERTSGRRDTLTRALAYLPEAREPLEAALRLEQHLHRRPAAPIEKLVSCSILLSERIAECLAQELETEGETAVRLLGTASPEGLPLVDWRALACPPLDGLQIPFERFVIAEGEPSARRIAELGEADGYPRGFLRAGPLLIQPDKRIWGFGRTRGVQFAATDPVSFALADGRSQAAFPDVDGWSARDWAWRAVAEHRAWFFGEKRRGGPRPVWMGIHPLADEAQQASLALLLSAARTVLFRESVEAGSPELALTREAVVEALARRDPAAGAAAAEAHEELLECEREERSPGPEAAKALLRVVAELLG